MKIIGKFFATVLLAVTAVIMPLAHADSLDIVVPFGPGGTNDVLGRFVAANLETPDRSVTVINKGGASGMIGTRYVLENPDIAANTLLMISGGPGLFAPQTADPVAYDIRRDFVPVALLARDSVVIAVPSSSAIQSAADLVTALKSSAGKMTYGYPSLLNKFSGTMFLKQVSAAATPVAYQGGAKTAVAVAGSQIDFAVLMYADVLNLEKQGKVRILGIADKQRHPAADHVPTFREQGIDFEHASWYAVLAPRGMDTARVSELADTIVQAVRRDQKHPVLNKVLVKDARPGPELARFLDDQFAVWLPVIQANR